MTNLPPSPTGPADSDASSPSEPVESAAPAASAASVAPAESAAPAASAATSPYRAADSAAPAASSAPATPYGAPVGSTAPSTAPWVQAGGQSPYPPQQTQPPFATQQPYGQQPYAGQPPYAGQAPQGQAQFSYPQQQGPYGHPAAAPGVPKTTDGPGLAALIIGIICMVIAIVPTEVFGSILLAGVGMTLGIIGLVLPARPRKQALWGLILSGASIIVGLIMTFVYAFGSVLTYY